MEENTMPFKREGDPAFPIENTEDNSEDSSTEEEEVVVPQSEEEEEEEITTEEKQDNFATHPRWKEREGDWKERFNEQEERHSKEIEKLRDNVEVKKTSDDSTEIPDWFGGDDKQWKDYERFNNDLISKAREEAVREIQEKGESDKKSIDAATSYMNSEVEALEKEYGVKIDRNKLLKTTLDERLVDTEGKWNYRVAYKLMKSSTDFKKQDNLNAKKKIAESTTSDKYSEEKTKDYSTSEDFKYTRPW